MKRTNPILDTLLEVLAIVALVILVAAGPSANAQRAYLDPVSVTNTVPASSTNSTPVAAAIDMEAYDEFSLLILGRLSSTGTSAVGYTLSNSVDGTNYVAAFTLPATASGTNWVWAHTNVNAQAFRWWKVSAIGNANANAWTNAAVFVGTKKGLFRYRPF